MDDQQEQTSTTLGDKFVFACSIFATSVLVLGATVTICIVLALCIVVLGARLA